MPLMRLEKTSSDCSWALWKLEEPTQALLEALDPPESDWEQWQNIRHPEKQREWLASRLATKQLLEAEGQRYGGIRKDQYGKPSLIGQPFRLSLSHTAQYGAAIIHRESKVGIDIEHPREKLQYLQQKFLSLSEQDDALNQVDKLCVYWCAKEVLYKLHDHKQLIFNRHLRIDPFAMQLNGQLTGQIAIQNDHCSYKIDYLFYQSLVIAYAY